MEKLPVINAALIKVTGVFSFSKKRISQFAQIGYEAIPLVDNMPGNDEPEYEKNLQQAVESTRKWYRDNYYREFAALMFTGDDDRHPMKALQRKQCFDLKFLLGPTGNRRIIPGQCVNQELFLFDNEIGMLSLTFEPEELDFYKISDLTVALKSFDTAMEFEGQQSAFHEFISKELLAGIPLRGANVQADDYSGSKFKIYTIISTEDADDGATYSRDKLVYEIGTGSRIGDMGSNGFNSPSEEYFQELMQNSIKVFNNYTGLALLDSFTIIGQGVMKSRAENYLSYNTYNRVYFAIYIFNVYIRYNIFRFNAIFNSNPVKTREEFQQFLNEYNFSHISFNFLPNIFHQKIHAALNIDNEIEYFEKRLGSLATSIQEDQEKRQATLLGIVSVLTGLSSVSDIFDLLEKFRANTGLESTPFYTLLVLLLIILAIPALAYLFPEHAKKVRRGISGKAKK